MAERAMGWLGWSPEIALGADVNLIEIALAGRRDLLQSIFGKTEDKATAKRPMTARSFRDMSRAHNKSWVRQKANG